MLEAAAAATAAVMPSPRLTHVRWRARYELAGEHGCMMGVRSLISHPHVSSQRRVLHMQLRLLASLPALNGSMRDERGRRRAFSITHSDLINAGLSEIIADAALNGDGDYDDDDDDYAGRQALDDSDNDSDDDALSDKPNMMKMP